MTTSLDDVKTSSHAARYIISVGQSTVSRVFYIVTDKEPSLLCSTDLSEAVILLLILHCIFWLEYPAKCKCSYTFLQERVLRHDAADSANWQSFCALHIFLYSSMYCIVLMVLCL